MAMTTERDVWGVWRRETVVQADLDEPLSSVVVFVKFISEHVKDGDDCIPRSVDGHDGVEETIEYSTESCDHSQRR